VTVPAGVKISIDADSGDIRADRIAVRAAHVHDVAGIARNDDAAKSITARTDSGDVTLRAR
jgi:hypothetical protein